MLKHVADGGTLLYLPDFYPSSDADALLHSLQSDASWRQERTSRGVLLPRLTAYYADPGVIYRYSGVTHPPTPWSPTLAAVREQVESVVDAPFNSVLLNYYRDGADSMGYHADDEPELGENPIVPSVSFGVERRFLLKHNGTGERITIILEHGSLLVMGGTLQHHWKHALPKMKNIGGERINLTFRQILVE